MRAHPPPDRRRAIKGLLLRTFELLGFFRLTRSMYARRLHILCYHGFELRDECDFRPQLFISRETFESRLAHLKEAKFSVLPLAEALQRLRDGTLPERAVAITIDDGFTSTSSVAAPSLTRFGMPATVYVTTYYMEKRVPVFRLAAQYLFWKAGEQVLQPRLQALFEHVGLGPLPGSSREAMWMLIRHGEKLPSEEERQALLEKLSETLQIEIRTLIDEQLLSIMSPAEVRGLATSGFAVELHTHRHRFPSASRSAAASEIEENRRLLESVTGQPARHFCYPSGIFEPVQWPWLDELGVESSTTCIPGLNTADTPRHGLYRFLDSEAIPQIEFRAEMAGFNELIRRLRAALDWRRSSAKGVSVAVGS